MRRVIPFFVFIMIALLALNPACKKETAGGNPRLAPASSAQAAPDFRVTSLDGQELGLTSLKGKIILVNFWATWCPPCRAEIPDFIEAYSELKDRGLEILGFSVDDLPEADLKAFVNKAGMNYPIALVGQEIVAAFKPGQYIPTSIFIDRNGRLRYKHVGRLSKDDLVKIFEALERE
ncbi:MAG: TlpA family protein disulfide reductase [Candidatus Saccharicenans sp.]|jgi:cytochrome c biogenesis protein CcmG/thiol:disulfide interchange protein DsbE|nr:TlpA family protein disulfide reductase [Candidatus Saccharicenans sp.]MDH7493730.1 TlpA disulfide reductase family protein [Candidatus Saccharicenans sp.]